AGTLIDAEVVLGTLLDSTLTLYDGAGVQLAFNDDHRGTLASQIVYRLPQNGTYYLAVRGVSNPGTYTLRLRVGQRVNFRHTYAAPGTYTAYSQSCCRISQCSNVGAHVNNPDGDYRIETLVQAGSGNSSPVSNLPPIVECPANGQCTFPVPVADDEGNAFPIRFSTATAAAG